jgi:tRNA dimethylallyltransferase
VTAPAIPLLLVLGPTAAGKSALAMDLAERLGGEVVSADALAVYRGLDIGTAKPTPAERARVPHHLIDTTDPDERSDLARWLAQAETAIADIHARSRRVVVAGGSPLYTKALVEGLSAGPPRDEAVRAALEARWTAEGPAVLFAELTRLDPVYAGQRHPNDRQRVVRALEVCQLAGRPYSSFHTTDGVRRTDYRATLIGLHWDKPVLHRRIDQRVAAMFAAGLVDEVRALRGHLCPEAAAGVGYKEVLAHLAGAHDLAHARALVTIATRHLAKHQLTWYRRWNDIHWLPGDAPDLLDRALALANPPTNHQPQPTAAP